MRPLAAAVSAAVTSLVVTMLLIGEAESSAPPGGVGSDRLEVYLVEVGPTDVELLAAAGVDTTHLPDLTEGGRVEIVATSRQARALRHQGLSVQVKRIHGVKARRSRRNGSRPDRPSTAPTAGPGASPRSCARSRRSTRASPSSSRSVPPGRGSRSWR